MSEGGDSGAEKPHDATPRKLEEARRKGQIVRSQDLTTAAGYLGLFAALTVFGAWSAERLGLAALMFLDQPDRLAPLFFDGGGGPAGGLLGAAVIAAAPWLLVPALAALLALIAQRAVAVTGENIAPRLSRISPLALAAQKFGRQGLFEFAKSAVKLVVISIVLGMFLAREAPRIVALAVLTPAAVIAELALILEAFLVPVIAVTAAIAALDYAWQHFEHLRQNRMTLQELRDETKDSDGDPHLKHERRRRGMDIATNRMLADVPKADVVIVNPTHYAVALKWSRTRGSAPVCVAKGVDEIAARIREMAAEAGIPIHRDPPTARAIHATVELGAEIAPEHYRAVAAAIRFAERIRRAARPRGAR